MTIFELIKTVLDEEYAQIPGTEVQRDASVRAALTRLEEHYKRVTASGPGNYSERATRFGYIHRYTTAHAIMVCQKIEGSRHLRDLFDRPKVEMACIGGGPGSDYLGVLKYLMRREKKPKLICNLFDREPSWNESWCDVDQKVETDLQLSLRFLTFDVAKPEEWKRYAKYQNADLFTLVFFMSEVVKLRTEAEPYFDDLFGKAKPGALFFFLDNNASEHYCWFDDLAKRHKLTVHQSTEGVMTLPSHEEKTDLEPYLTKFKNPRLSPNVAFRLAQKPGV